MSSWIFDGAVDVSQNMGDIFLKMTVVYLRLLCVKGNDVFIIIIIIL